MATYTPLDVRASKHKNIYVVIGMARSGTSVITRGLKALGIDLGEHLYPANERNPKGFWEDVDVAYKINRSLLYLLDYPMFHTEIEKAMQAELPKLNDFKSYAVKLLENRMADKNDWAFKDPRTGILLPFWQQIFPVLPVRDKYVIALRNPLASASSSQVLTKKDLEGGLLAWLLHSMSAIECTHDKQRVVVAYELMMKEPKLQLERIKRALAIDLPGNEEEVNTYINEFLDTKLQHHEFSEADLARHPAVAVVPLCVDLYQLLSKLARDEVQFHTEVFQTAWRKIQADFVRAYPVYQYILTILKKSKAVERELRTINKSWPWKLLYPIRVIDDILRSRRKKTREKNKWVKVYG